MDVAGFDVGPCHQRSGNGCQIGLEDSFDEFVICLAVHCCLNVSHSPVFLCRDQAMRANLESPYSTCAVLPAEIGAKRRLARDRRKFTPRHAKNSSLCASLSLGLPPQR
jgi:hypothetical protein